MKYIISLILLIISVTLSSQDIVDSVDLSYGEKKGIIDPADTEKYVREYYTPEEMQLIKDSFPQLHTYEYDIVENPDDLYFRYPMFCSNYSFGSEAGQDEYYILYAYFLKQKNGNENDDVRQKLIKIYRNINEMMGSISYGGTYFGHMYDRLVGYAEYSLYMYPTYLNGLDLMGTYDIKPQQKLFIQTLKQMADDELSIDIYDAIIETREERTENFYRIINDLDNLITDKFLLRAAQEFLYSKY